MSRARLEEHRRLWARKPLLARLYAPWFELLLRETPQDGRVVEVGAGPGTLRRFASERRPDLRWLATDLEPVPWNQVAADAGRLPVRNGWADAVLGLDVLHHLADPGAFFAEAGRVLAPGGRLALVEPWVSPLSWPIYRLMHEEDCRLSGDPWRPFPGPAKAAFDGDAALPWRLARAAREQDWLRFGLGPPRIVRLPAFAYLLGLGFREASLLPMPLAGPLQRLDRATAPFGRLLALRASLVWPRRAVASDEGPTTPGAGRAFSC